MSTTATSARPADNSFSESVDAEGTRISRFTPCRSSAPSLTAV